MVCSFLLLLVLVAAPAHAQPVVMAVESESELVRVKTTKGCTILESPSLARMSSQSGVKSITWDWSGECTDGLGSGHGVLRFVTKMNEGNAAIELSTVTSGLMKQGQFQGFITFATEDFIPSTGKRRLGKPEYFFDFAGRRVMFGGLGLTASDAVLDPASNALPARNFDWAKEFIGIGDSRLGSLMLVKEPCGYLKQRFPECGLNPGDPNYEVYSFTRMSPNGTDRSHVYCPNPREKSSCAELAERLSRPFVDSIETFLIESIPKIYEPASAKRTAAAAAELWIMRGEELIRECAKPDDAKTAGRDARGQS